MINVGIIGYGYWGPNLVRNFMASSATKVVKVCDREAVELDKLAAKYPKTPATHSADELIADRSVHAVVIATPVDTHFELAMKALQADKHVLIEKPIASSSDQAQRLIDEAGRRGLVLLVDHTFLYTPSVRKMRDLVDDPDFGAIRYYDSTRVNLGNFQHDVNVLWDLAVHDLSIMAYLLRQKPVAVSATGQSLKHQRQYAAFLTVFFDDMIGHINVNWLSPVKIRRTLVGGSKKMIVYDDLEKSDKVKLYDSGITMTPSAEDVRKMLISYRVGTLISPQLDEAEALSVEVEHFAACIRGEEKPLTSGEDALQLVRILEAADHSMAQRGAPVAL